MGSAPTATLMKVMLLEKGTLPTALSVTPKVHSESHGYPQHASSEPQVVGHQ